MAEIRNQTLSGDQLIDGNTYIDCTFDGARLIYEGGLPPGFLNTSFQNSNFRFQGAAGNTLTFLKAMAPARTGMRHMVQGLLPELYD
jgi:hypothetical protein